MKTLKTLAAVLLAGAMAAGCVSHKEAIPEPVRAYRPPQAHMELQKSLLSRQEQFMLSTEDSQNLIYTEEYGHQEEK